MTIGTRGFSLIEVLLSVVIIGMLVGMSLPLYQAYQTRNDLDVATESIAQMLRRAQTYSRGMNEDSQWGVHATAGSATLFKGATYASRDTTYDETVTIPASFSVTAGSDVLFSKLYAVPTTTGNVVTITATNTNDTRTVTINGAGMVSY